MAETLLNDKPFFKTQNLEYAYDSLTKVLNREMTGQYIKYLIENDIPFSLCLTDIDNFKYVNDTYGHMMGDQVLYKVAQKLVDSVGNQCVVGRYGGDEFMIIAEGITEYNQVWNICHKINKDMLDMRFEEIQELSVTLTTGVSRFPLDGKNYEDIINTSDKALYRGKTKGRNCFIVYLAEKHANIEHNPNKEALYNSMDMHARIFSILAKETDIKQNVKFLFRFLSNSLMIDHVCIESKDKIVMSLIHPLSKVKKFDYIDTTLFDEVVNAMGLFYVSQRKTLLQVHHNELFNTLTSQQIRSMMACKIEAYGKTYGYLRFDMSGKERLWQSLEMDLFVTSAKLLGTILYHLGKELSDLE